MYSVVEDAVWETTLDVGKTVKPETSPTRAKTESVFIMFIIIVAVVVVVDDVVVVRDGCLVCPSVREGVCCPTVCVSSFLAEKDLVRSSCLLDFSTLNFCGYDVTATAMPLIPDRGFFAFSRSCDGRYWTKMLAR